MNKNLIILAAGGTGGHVFPAVAVSKLIKKFRPVIYCDDRSAPYLKDLTGIDYFKLDIHRPGISFFDRLRCLKSLVKATYTCLYNFIKMRPKAIVGFGGYPTAPVLMAGIILFIPIIIHQQDAVLGGVNRYFQYFARYISLGFRNTINLSRIASNRVHVNGVVIREGFNIVSSKENKNEFFNILIIGGSQGAKSLSLPIISALGFLNDEYRSKLMVYHQVRAEYLAQAKKAYNELKIKNKTAAFFEDINEKFKQADLVISRAGASSVAEIMASGKASILIPLPSAKNNHQYFNAKFLSDNSAAYLIEEKDFSAPAFVRRIEHLIDTPDLKNLIGKKAKKLANLTAAQKIAEYVETL